MARLLSLDKAAEALGGISIWTLRKHVSRGNVRVKHLGRRVFLDEEELARITREGLPSLRGIETKSQSMHCALESRAVPLAKEFVASGKAAHDKCPNQIQTGEET